VDADELQKRVDALAWFHTIDLGNGVVTPGMGRGKKLSIEELPDFEGRTVLDIGAWDGFFSFMAEQHGASHVTALDHYAWGVMLHQRQLYWEECAARGELPDHSRDTTDFWDPELHGKWAFDLAKEALDSKVEPVVADFMTMDLADLGTFDVVLHLGVLYHIKEPLAALERVRQVTREVAVVETEAVAVAGYEDQELVWFTAGNELNRDFGNWYVPSIRALRAMCRAAGFSRIETVWGESDVVEPAQPGVEDRGRRWRPGKAPPAAELPARIMKFYRAAVHAFV
jgi:tRNA (mo5U34)-methyltransferase